MSSFEADDVEIKLKSSQHFSPRQRQLSTTKRAFSGRPEGNLEACEPLIHDGKNKIARRYRVTTQSLIMITLSLSLGSVSRPTNIANRRNRQTPASRSVAARNDSMSLLSPSLYINHFPSPSDTMLTNISRRFYSATSRTMATKNLQVGWVSLRRMHCRGHTELVMADCDG